MGRVAMSAKEELSLTLHLLKKNASGMIGIAIVAFFLVIAVSAPFLAPYDPLEIHYDNRLLLPSHSHLLGTDNLGRDILSRILYGVEYTLGSAVLCVILTVSLGAFIGLISGYFGGMVDELIMRITDIFLAFPSLILAMAVAAALKPSLFNAIAAILVSYWPRYARLARGSVLSEKEKLYVKAAKVTGENNINILFRHILPNTLTPLIVQATVDVGSMILSIANLGFVGVGAQPPTPEWGLMASSGRQYLTIQPTVALFPGFAIMLAVFGFILLGDAFRDILDPRIRYQ